MTTHNRWQFPYCATFLFALLWPYASYAQPVTLTKPVTLNSTASDQEELILTIYPGNLARVIDNRTLNIPRGEHTVAFTGISEKLRPQTALLRNISNADALTVLEQHFDYDGLSPQKLLEKSQGQTVSLARINSVTGERIIEPAQILSTQNGVVVQVGQRIEANPPGQFIFNTLPPSLRTQPTLTTTLNNQRAGQQDYALSYLTQGLSWQTDYVVELSATTYSDGDTHNIQSLDLTGRVTLSNQSNTDYRNATVQLMAGTIRQVTPSPSRLALQSRSAEIVQATAPPENLFEHKLYTLPRKTTLLNKQTKQINLLSARNVKSQKHLVFKPSAISRYNQKPQTQTLKPSVHLTLRNTQQANLGLALPQGIVRVYQRDSQGNTQFVGEDAINATAHNETLTLTLGKSFDVSAKRTLADFKILKHNDKQTITFSTRYNVVLSNAKDEPVTVEYIESFSGEWALTRSNITPRSTQAYQASWHITIPAKSETTLNFSAKVQQ